MRHTLKHTQTKVDGPILKVDYFVSLASAKLTLNLHKYIKWTIALVFLFALNSFFRVFAYFAVLLLVCLFLLLLSLYAVAVADAHSIFLIMLCIHMHAIMGHWVTRYSCCVFFINFMFFFANKWIFNAQCLCVRIG